MESERGTRGASFIKSLGIYLGISAAIDIVGFLIALLGGWSMSVPRTMVIASVIGLVIFCVIYFVVVASIDRRRSTGR